MVPIGHVGDKVNCVGKPYNMLPKYRLLLAARAHQAGMEVRLDLSLKVDIQVNIGRRADAH